MGGRGGSSMSANANNKGAAKSMQASVGDWYREAFPTDDLGEEINPSISFDEASKNLNNFYDFFPADSLVRERVFLELANRTGKTYQYFYDKWLNG